MQFNTILWVHNSRPWAIKILYGHYICVPTNNHGVPPSFESTLWPIIYLYEGKRRYLYRQLLRGERNDKTHKHCTESFTSGHYILLFRLITFQIIEMTMKEKLYSVWSFLLRGKVPDLLPSTCGFHLTDISLSNKWGRWSSELTQFVARDFLVCGEIFCFVTGWEVFNAI